MSSVSAPRNRLFDIDVDEVSSVDRPANQFGKHVITKAMEDPMPDSDTLEVDGQLELVHGEDYVDEEGNVYTYVELDEEGEPMPVEGVEFGVNDEGELFVADEDEGGEYEGEGDPEYGKAFNFSALKPAFKGGQRLGLAGRAGGEGAAGRVGNVAGRTERFARKNPLKASAIGAGVAGTAAGGSYMLASKSAGTEVLEALSKALTDEDRNTIVAKMADDLEETRAENYEIAKALEEERDIRVTEAFIAKAAEYDLPVDPGVFGPILKACAEVLTDEELDVLDEVLASKTLYDEVGVGGGALPGDAFAEVSGYAAELVGKAAGGLTMEQATAAIYEANPGAYEAYLTEQSGR